MKPSHYFVITFNRDGNDFTRQRCHGFFSSQEDAIKCVKENWGDIYENGYYNFVLIEPYTEGLYGGMFPDEMKFFIVEPVFGDKYIESYTIVETEKPEYFDFTVGYGLS